LTYSSLLRLINALRQLFAVSNQQVKVRGQRMLTLDQGVEERVGGSDAARKIREDDSISRAVVVHHAHEQSCRYVLHVPFALSEWTKSSSSAGVQNNCYERKSAEDREQRASR
jgi:hypothetical protein